MLLIDFPGVTVLSAMSRQHSHAAAVAASEGFAQELIGFRVI
jgi:hypothetical protein